MAHVKRAKPAVVDPDLADDADLMPMDEEERDEEDTEELERDECQEDEEDDEEGASEEIAVPSLRVGTEKKKRAPKPPGEAAQMEAFRAGIAAHDAGIVFYNSPTMHESLIFHWMSGWRVANTEATQGAGIVVRCLYDPDVRGIGDLNQAYRDFMALWGKPGPDLRSAFPILPWSMAELIGSTWRNIHTGRAVTVGPVCADSFGHPHLCAPSAIMRDIRYRYHNTTIGLWLTQSYSVEHWVRVDHWRPVEQMPWIAMEIARARDDIATAKESAGVFKGRVGSDSTATFNYNGRLHDIVQAQDTLRRSLEYLHAFSTAHDLPVTSAMINGTEFRSRQPAPHVSEQMSLF